MVFLTKINVLLDSVSVNMMAVCMLRSGIPIWYTDDKINTGLHWVSRIKLLIGSSLLFQVVQHIIIDRICGTSWFGIRNRVKGHHPMTGERCADIRIKGWW